MEGRGREERWEKMQEKSLRRGKGNREREEREGGKEEEKIVGERRKGEHWKRGKREKRRGENMIDREEGKVNLPASMPIILPISPAFS